MAIEIVSFREFQKNTLQGFVNLRLTNIGLEIREVCLHEKNGKRWLAFPSKPWTDNNGAQQWAIVLKFYDDSKLEQFQKYALAALDQFRIK